METNVAITEETQKLLNIQREPNYAYIMFEKKGYSLVPPGDYVPSNGIAILNVEQRPEQATKLDYYVMQKGFKVIGYGNFPKLDDRNPRRRALAKWHSGPEGDNPWDSLEKRCKFYMGQAAEKGQLAKLQEEKSALEAQLEEMKKQVAKKNQGDKHDKAEGSNRI